MLSEAGSPAIADGEDEAVDDVSADFKSAFELVEERGSPVSDNLNLAQKRKGHFGVGGGTQQQLEDAKLKANLSKYAIPNTHTHTKFKQTKKSAQCRGCPAPIRKSPTPENHMPEKRT